MRGPEFVEQVDKLGALIFAGRGEQVVLFVDLFADEIERGDLPRDIRAERVQSRFGFAGNCGDFLIGGPDAGGGFLRDGAGACGGLVGDKCGGLRDLLQFGAGGIHFVHGGAEFRDEMLVVLFHRFPNHGRLVGKRRDGVLKAAQILFHLG